MKLTFHGGAGSVTGANYLLEVKGEKILIDCGLQQGGRYAERQNFNPFPYSPKEITAVFITHAHLDHIGLLPKLVREGFRGTVYSTSPTRALAQLLLEDAEGILAQEAQVFNVKQLYTTADIEELMTLWQSVPYHELVSTKNFTIYFHNAGHILGSSFIRVIAEDKTVIFSGDLGNTPPPLIQPIEYIEKADYCLIESTYGDRVHGQTGQMKEALEDVIEDAVNKKGVLMIPAFAMERTQDLLFHLNELMEQGRIPHVSVFIDSPLAIRLTEAYKRFRNELSDATKQFLDQGHALFDFPGLRKTLTTEESKSINQAPPPKIVIAGSGMSNGGRILYHERLYLGDSKNTILFVGYQAKGSLGRRILDGEKHVTIFDEEVSVRAQVRSIDAYSAHADQPQLLKWLEPMRFSLKKVFVVQGEEEQSLPLTQKIKDELAILAEVPEAGETVTL